MLDQLRTELRRVQSKIDSAEKYYVQSLERLQKATTDILEDESLAKSKSYTRHYLIQAELDMLAYANDTLPHLYAQRDVLTRIFGETDKPDVKLKTFLSDLDKSGINTNRLNIIDSEEETKPDVWVVTFVNKHSQPELWKIFDTKEEAINEVRMLHEEGYTRPYMDAWELGVNNYGHKDEDNYHE